MNSAFIGFRVAMMFDPRRYIIVPNVSWGLGLHECDLLMVNKDGYGTEVEVKISRSDIIADQKKPHHRRHTCDRIKRLYFAIPTKLRHCRDLIPAHAGIITVDDDGRCEVERRPENNRMARVWTTAERLELVRNASIKYWRLVGRDKPWKDQPDADPEELEAQVQHH